MVVKKTAALDVCFEMDTKTLVRTMGVTNEKQPRFLWRCVNEQKGTQTGHSGRNEGKSGVERKEAREGGIKEADDGSADHTVRTRNCARTSTTIGSSATTALTKTPKEAIATQQTTAADDDLSNRFEAQLSIGDGNSSDSEGTKQRRQYSQKRLEKADQATRNGEGSKPAEQLAEARENADNSSKSGRNDSSDASRNCRKEHKTVRGGKSPTHDITDNSSSYNCHNTKDNNNHNDFTTMDTQMDGNQMQVQAQAQNQHNAKRVSSANESSDEQTRLFNLAKMGAAVVEPSNSGNSSSNNRSNGMNNLRQVSTNIVAASSSTTHSASNDDDAVIAAPAPTNDPSPRQAAQIPLDEGDAKPEAVAQANVDVDADARVAANASTEAAMSADGSDAPISSDPSAHATDADAEEAQTTMGDDEEEDDESDFEYEYEDEDEVAYSGFIMQSEHANTFSTASTPAAAVATTGAAIVEEDSAPSPMAASASSPVAASASAAPAAPNSLFSASSSPAEAAPKRKWREPTRQAVNMSLRAQSESTGSKRRLAQDLYKIMNQDTLESGFSLSPQSEDSMERWKIQLFQFDADSNLAKDMLVLGLENVELEMSFPDQYPFEPPFVRVVKPRFKRQTGFVMNGALCMELLTKEGWNPVNDIESVIVSVRSLLVVGDGRLQAATDLTEAKYNSLLAAAQKEAKEKSSAKDGDDNNEEETATPSKRHRKSAPAHRRPATASQVGTYSASEAKSAYSHLSDYHKKKGWDSSGWWSKMG